MNGKRSRLAHIGSSASRNLPFASPVCLSPTARPQLLVVVDTEEEFDWNAPFARSNTAVTAMKHIFRVQRIFDRFAIRPTYVIDYPVASQAAGRLPLQEIWDAGHCTIGAHLHPWVNPPYPEDVNRRNSFTCNLPVDVQHAKLRVLCETIQSHFGSAPQVFKAGRYGIGAATVALLDTMGFEVDASISPRMDYTAEGGPSFASYDAQPFFLTPRLLEIPCTVDYTGWGGALRPVLHRIASVPALVPFRAPGVLIRIGLVNRIGLSPEGNTFREMRALTEALFDRGARTFTLSFHSPSVVPGHTPYVRTQTDLDTFLRDIEQYCTFFMNDLNGVPATPLEFRGAVLSGRKFAS